MFILALLIVASTSVWVVIDASNLGVRRGDFPNDSIANSNPISWFFGCLLLWALQFIRV